MDEKGPLEDYDFSKDEMSDEELATLQLVLQTLKSVRATGLTRKCMKKFKNEENLKTKHLKRIWQISAWSEKTNKFYYRKYIRLSHVILLPFSEFKKLLR